MGVPIEMGGGVGPAYMYLCVTGYGRQGEQLSQCTWGSYGAAESQVQVPEAPHLWTRLLLLFLGQEVAV